MANNANVIVKKPGHISGSTEAVELPADFISALQALEQAAIVIETPISSGKFYRVDQVN